MLIHVAATWVRRQLSKVKVFLVVVLGIAALVFLHAREREGKTWEKRKEKKKHLFSIVCGNGVLVFKYCHLSINHVQDMCC